MYECSGSQHWVVVSSLSISIFLTYRDIHVIASDLVMYLGCIDSGVPFLSRPSDAVAFLLHCPVSVRTSKSSRDGVGSVAHLKNCPKFEPYFDWKGNR